MRKLRITKSSLVSVLNLICREDDASFFLNQSPCEVKRNRRNLAPSCEKAQWHTASVVVFIVFLVLFPFCSLFFKVNCVLYTKCEPAILICFLRSIKLLLQEGEKKTELLTHRFAWYNYCRREIQSPSTWWEVFLHSGPFGIHNSRKHLWSGQSQISSQDYHRRQEYYALPDRGEWISSVTSIPERTKKVMKVKKYFGKEKNCTAR